MARLADKIAFITGAGAGIGRATAILFAREGAKVAIAEIDAPAGEETAHLAGNEAIAIRTDVTDPDSLQSAIRATVDKFGRLDVLHNNAGGGDVESAFTRDRLLANISLYWFTGAIGSSFWPYYARMHGPWPIPEGQTIDVPTGYAQFPREIIRPPRTLAARTYSDIRRWSVMPRGGHFAALEQPEALANEVREFFRPLRR